MSRRATLRELLYDHTIPAARELVTVEPDRSVRCSACGHRCHIRPDKSGICLMRFNRDGELRVPGGYVAGLAIDPIEKKPFYHVLPGSEALSFGMLGCNFHCKFCQNWVSSQALRDDRAVSEPSQYCTPEQIVQAALDHEVPIITSTYNEPLITSEWSAEIFRLASAEGILCGYVSNGHGTPEVIEFLRPHMSLFNIDLKCFDADNYRELGGRFEAVTDTIRRAHEMDFWVEVVTLVVPGFNDGDDELKRTAEFIASVSEDIPWHCTAYRPMYKSTEPKSTPPSTLARAYELGKAAGLKHVYSGNLPGLVGETEHTYCPSCKARLVERRGFYVSSCRLVGEACPDCGMRIAGRFEPKGQGPSRSSGVPRPAGL
ncbi:MAG: AmmeMemoRadiSam system radical SAM enzyme [Phycisphaerae bacterium]|nr:AmmeMemoRadiSam system radical SAM enzyme [Phycisphaerae bacterium]